MALKLYIQIKDGNPINHPILEDNLVQAFPNIDLINLPPEFAKFMRIPTPEIGVYEIYEGVTYEWEDNIVKDVHHVRQMTNAEKTLKQNEVKENWANNNGFPSWVFNEITCSFGPPIPYPNDGKNYNWDEETTQWVEITEA